MRRLFLSRVLTGALLLTAAVLFLASSAAAQTTLVTGTVTDSNGTPYATGTIKAQLVLNGAGVTGTPTVTVVGIQACRSSGFGSSPCQVPFQGTQGPITLDGTGSFSMALQDNALVTPAGTQWLFSVTISPGIPPPGGTGPQSCTATVTITGASQSVSGSFSTCPLLSATGTGGGGGTANLTYTNITTGTTAAPVCTTPRSGSGSLGSIQVNNPGAGWTVQIFDNTSCTGTTIATTSSLLQLNGQTLNYFVKFLTGLSILTTGSIPGDITVGWSTTQGSFSFSNITANANTQIKSGSGSLNFIQVNNPGAGWTLKLFDNTSCTGTPIATTGSLLQARSFTLKFISKFTTGLCITTAGTTPGNITVSSS